MKELNVRPLPGTPPVLNDAERKLQEIESVVLDFDGRTFADSGEATTYLMNKWKEIKKILNR